MRGGRNRSCIIAMKRCRSCLLYNLLLLALFLLVVIFSDFRAQNETRGREVEEEIKASQEFPDENEIIDKSGEIAAQESSLTNVSKPTVTPSQVRNRPESTPRSHEDQDIEDIFKQRRELLAQGCEKHKDEIKQEVNRYSADLESFEREFIIYVKPHNFTYCVTAKTGSSTWKVQLLSMTGKHVSKGHLNKELVKRYAISENRTQRVEQLKESTTFMFVRHPFVRFVSAYKYRSHSPNILDGVSRYLGRKIRRGAPVPFDVFVDYFLHVGLRLVGDAHFNTFWFHCNVCRNHVDWIGHQETTDRDKKYIIKKLNLTFSNSDMKYNVGQGGQVEEESTKKFYNMLTNSQIRQLYEVYKLDFELFGYDPEPYLSLGKDRLQ